MESYRENGRFRQFLFHNLLVVLTFDQNRSVIGPARKRIFSQVPNETEYWIIAAYLPTRRARTLTFQSQRLKPQLNDYFKQSSGGHEQHSMELGKSSSIGKTIFFSEKKIPY